LKSKIIPLKENTKEVIWWCTHMMTEIQVKD